MEYQAVNAGAQANCFSSRRPPAPCSQCPIRALLHAAGTGTGDTLVQGDTAQHQHHGIKTLPCAALDTVSEEAAAQNVII